MEHLQSLLSTPQVAADEERPQLSESGSPVRQTHFDPEGQSELGFKEQHHNQSSSSATKERVIPLLVTDPNMLHCPICFNALSSPVYQCEMGHILCSCCHSKVKKCPFRCMPSNLFRSVAMEKLIVSLRVECKYTSVGCKERPIYHEKDAHEVKCPRATSYCHVPFYGHSLATYFTYDTTFSLLLEKTQKHLFLKEFNEGAIFILHYEYDPQRPDRLMVRFECIKPGGLDQAFAYFIGVKDRWLISINKACKQEPEPDNYKLLDLPENELFNFSTLVRIEKVWEPIKGKASLRFRAPPGSI